MQPTVSLENAVSVHKKSVAASPSNGTHRRISVHLFDEDISNQSTVHLMQLSGMMPAINCKPDASANTQSANGRNSLGDEDGYWPYGIQQTGALPVINSGTKPFGKTMPLASLGVPITVPVVKPKQPAWKALLNSPTVKVVLGLLIGVGLLFLVAQFVNLPATIAILRTNLATRYTSGSSCRCMLSYGIIVVIHNIFKISETLGKVGIHSSSYCALPGRCIPQFPATNTWW